MTSIGIWGMVGREICNYRQTMRPFITNITLLLLLHVAVFAQTPRAEWTEGAADSSGHALHTLVLHNVSKGSRVWFQELFDGRTYIKGPAMHHYQGTSWYIDTRKAARSR